MNQLYHHDKIIMALGRTVQTGAISVNKRYRETKNLSMTVQSNDDPEAFTAPKISDELSEENPPLVATESTSSNNLPGVEEVPPRTSQTNANSIGRSDLFDSTDEPDSKVPPDTSNTITVPAFICNQGKKSFYYFTLNATQLAQIAYVSKREDSPQGYQRLLDKRRADEIKSYIERGSPLPNNIILNFDNPSALHFDEKNRTLTFPDKKRVAWVIDGQHRLFGADLLNDDLFGQEIADAYQFTVSAFVGLDNVEQARIFLDINSYQVGVDKSLLYDLLDLFKTDDASPEFYLARGSDIVKRLNREPESPFFERISLTKDRVRGTISQAAFVDALVLHLERGGILSTSST